MAYLIDPTSRSIREVGCDDASLKPFKTSDPRYLNDEGDVIYESAEGDGYSVIEGVRRPLKGVICIVGTTVTGYDCEPQVSADWLKENIDFGTANNGMFFGERIVRNIND